MTSKHLFVVFKKNKNTTPLKFTGEISARQKQLYSLR